MIDSGVPPLAKWPAGVLDNLKRWEQGNLVRYPPFFYFADPNVPIWSATMDYSADSEGPEIILPEGDNLPLYGIITTQTCDIAEEDSDRPIRPWIQMSPVYSTKSWKKSKLEDGKGPRYLFLIPDIDEPGVWVADFRIEIPIEKGWLANQEPIQGFRDDEEKHKLGERLAWLRSRPAWSPPLVEAIRSLNRKLQSLYQQDESYLGDELERSLEEVAVLVDDYSEQHEVQFVFITSDNLSDDCKELLGQWWDSAREEANRSNLTLHASDFVKSENLSLADYRKMTRVLSFR